MSWSRAGPSPTMATDGLGLAEDGIPAVGLRPCQDAAGTRPWPAYAPATPMIRTKMEQKYRFLTRCSLHGASDEVMHGGKQAVLCGDFNIARRSTSRTPRPTKARRLPARGARSADKWLDEYEFQTMCSARRRYSGPRTRGGASAGALTTNVGLAHHQFATPELAETARGLCDRQGPHIRVALVRPRATYHHIRRVTQLRPSASVRQGCKPLHETSE